MYVCVCVTCVCVCVCVCVCARVCVYLCRWVGGWVGGHVPVRASLKIRPLLTLGEAGWGWEGYRYLAANMALLGRCGVGRALSHFSSP